MVTFSCVKCRQHEHIERPGLKGNRVALRCMKCKKITIHIRVKP